MIYLITGGQRSGKSTYAERLALHLTDKPIYMATAHIWDDEFAERVRLHQQRRVPEWTNIEEDIQLSRHDVHGRVVLVDCCTLWATNYISNNEGSSVQELLTEMQSEFDRFTAQDATFIFVTNEIGLGGTSSNALQRRFTDLLGMLNQYIASRADVVTLMVCGIPVAVKGCLTIDNQ